MPSEEHKIHICSSSKRDILNFCILSLSLMESDPRLARAAKRMEVDALATVLNLSEITHTILDALAPMS